MSFSFVPWPLSSLLYADCSSCSNSTYSDRDFEVGVGGMINYTKWRGLLILYVINRKTGIYETSGVLTRQGNPDSSPRFLDDNPIDFSV